MRKSYFTLILLVAASFMTQAQHTQDCAFDAIRAQQLNDPAYALQEQLDEERLQEFIRNAANNKSSSTILTIPIVIHVLHLGEAVGTGSNISDAQIMSSINHLNDFYRGNTANSTVDFEIEFELAQRDPNCNSTTGINRINASGLSGYAANGVNVENSNGASYTDIKNIISWPQTEYFNVWIVTELDNNGGGSGYQGYAYFYSDTSSGFGSVMMSTVFGYDPGNTNGWGLNSNGDNSTVVHEVGHYFHLYHTFQGDNDNTTCPSDSTVGTDSDGCADTVPHKRETSTCPSTNSCTGSAWVDNNTINNIMSYYNCSDRLTNDQKTRVRAVMETATISNSKGAIAPDPSYAAPTSVCATNSTSTNNSGITSVTINGKTYTSFSSASDGGNIDNSGSCSGFFEIDASNSYNIDVGMFSVNWQQLGVWIDWNDDGTFDDDNEQQYLDGDIAADSTISIPIVFPSSIPYGDYVRIRLITDVDDRYSGVDAINSACYTSLVTGQSEDYALYVQPTLSVVDQDINALQVFTNTTNQSIVIKGQLNAPTKAYIYDIQGRLMFNKELNTTITQNNINTSALSTGIYIIKMDNGTQQKTQKLIIR